jgi:CHRD domain
MRQPKRLTALIAGLALVALAVPALSAAGNNTTELTSKLKGKNVVDGGIDKGGAMLDVLAKPTQSKLCLNFSVKKLDPITSGAIHKGLEGEVGKPKITLFSDDTGLDGTGSYEGCVKNVKSSLLEKIAANPEKFYADITSKAYPDGAIRGQLKLAPVAAPN